MSNQRQSFADKVFSAIFLLFFLKVVYILFQSTKLGLNEVILSIIVSVVLFFVLAGIARSQENNFFSDTESDSKILVRNSIFSKIQQKYYDLAQKYINEKNYKQAAHIYFKLLNDKYLAAETLKQGKLYNEAAQLYLKHLNNKYQAAECFEKGCSYSQALKLYLELDNFEKVGDMYVLLNNTNEAHKYYNKVIDEYKEKNQYVKAALLYRNKLNDTTTAQALLLEGWRNNKDAYNCLNNYFINITDQSKLEQQLKQVYKFETDPTNRGTFLQVLKLEHQKNEALHETTRELAYEIIAELIEKDKFIASELIHFNKENHGITKDVMKFKASKKTKN